MLHNILMNVLWMKTKAGVAKTKEVTYITRKSNTLEN